MTGNYRREALDQRVEEVRRHLRERRTTVVPDRFFADRVVARLPRGASPMLAWAARRVVPVTLAVAAALTVAVVVTGRSSGGAGSTTSVSAATQSTNDPLEWLLDNGQGVR